MKWHNTDDDAPRLAHAMKAYAQEHPWRPGERLRPYRRFYKMIIEIAFYIDTQHQIAILELVNLLNGTRAFPQDKMQDFYRAFSVPLTATHIAPNPNYKHKYTWAVHTQPDLFHTVK